MAADTALLETFTCPNCGRKLTVSLTKDGVISGSLEAPAYKECECKMLLELKLSVFNSGSRHLAVVSMRPINHAVAGAAGAT